MAKRDIQVGPEAEAGWKEEWSWRDKKGVWRKRTIYGKGKAKALTVEEAGPFVHVRRYLPPAPQRQRRKKWE